MKRIILCLTATMKRINLYVIGILFLFLCSACREEHIAPVNQLVKDLFCFKTGSEWVYYDSISQSTQKMVITNYEITRWGAVLPEGIGKVYDIAEGIEIDIAIENSMQSSIRNSKTILTSFLGNKYQDNTAEGNVTTPVENFSLRIHCDENNIFTPSAIYLSTYTLNENTYSDVYVFNSKDNIDFYASKHIGFIRCKKDNKYDFILIEKNVKQ